MEDVLLPLHLATLALTAVCIFLADREAVDWMRGKKALLEEAYVRKLHLLVWAGLVVMILTGGAMFWPARDFLLARGDFWIKMGFVGALFVNSFLIHQSLKIPTRSTYASLSREDRLPLLISGAISGISWIGAFLAAFFLFPD